MFTFLLLQPRSFKGHPSCGNRSHAPNPRARFMSYQGRRWSQHVARGAIDMLVCQTLTKYYMNEYIYVEFELQSNIS